MDSPDLSIECGMCRGTGVDRGAECLCVNSYQPSPPDDVEKIHGPPGPAVFREVQVMVEDEDNGRTVFYDVEGWVSVSADGNEYDVVLGDAHCVWPHFHDAAKWLPKKLQEEAKDLLAEVARQGGL